jgi:hypothetical protein
VSYPATVQRACGTLSSKWAQWDSVAPDGTFHFANLPSGGVEVVAGCDGYYSKDGAPRPKPGILTAQSVDRDQPITIQMEKTGDVRVIVFKPDKSPLPGAKVYFCPNQQIGLGTSIVGTRFNSLDYLEAIDKGSKTAPLFQRSCFDATTDERGTAIVKGLPKGAQRFRVMSDSYEMPIDKSESLPGRHLSVSVQEERETEIRVTMEPPNSSSLSAAMKKTFGRNRDAH